MAAQAKLRARRPAATLSGKKVWRITACATGTSEQSAARCCHSCRNETGHWKSILTHTCNTQAIQIFEANPDRGAPVRKLATDLALQFGITAKAVRDIWLLRTGAWTSQPSWMQTDHDHFNLNKRPSRLCEACKARDVRSRSDACQICAGPPRRGRPAIQRTFLLDAAAQVEEDSLDWRALLLPDA
ncbi:MAG: hypothetical protein ACPIOQ_32415 [Promethearchaeia archaeon]